MPDQNLYMAGQPTYHRYKVNKSENIICETSACAEYNFKNATCFVASAMQCSFGGLVISCPTAFDDSDKAFCCQAGETSIQVCCNIEDYARQK